jgi:hypothetical protein
MATDIKRITPDRLKMLKRGDRARHIGGGPLMTMLRMQWSHCGAIVKCFWKYEDGKRGCAWFPFRDLETLENQERANG